MEYFLGGDVIPVGVGGPSQRWRIRIWVCNWVRVDGGKVVIGPTLEKVANVLCPLLWSNWIEGWKGGLSCLQICSLDRLRKRVKVHLIQAVDDVIACSLSPLLYLL